MIHFQVLHFLNKRFKKLIIFTSLETPIKRGGPKTDGKPWVRHCSASCECGAEEQTDVVLHSPINQPPREVHGLTVLDDATTEWLLNT